MKTHGSYHLKEEKRLITLIELIAEDVKIHKFLHFLNKHGRGEYFLHLSKREEIFTLVGIKAQNIDDELRDWYFEMTKKALTIDVYEEEEKLIALATEILVKLNKKRYEE